MNIKYLKEWENELNVCIRCAYCFEGCPMYKHLSWEADTPRGKTILAYGLLSGELEPSQYIADKIFQCTYCKDCTERCAANVSVSDILTAVRSDLIDAGYKYDTHLNLLDKIKRTGNIFGEKLSPPPIEEGETPVLLGCRFLERSEDAKKYLEMLKKLGIKPKVFDETCCGMPFAVLGYKDDFKNQQDEFRKRLPSKEIICLCTTCVFFIRKAYPDLKAIYVIDEVVKRLPESNHKKLGMKVTYHDPCNVSRGMNMVEEPRTILDEIGVELVEMPTHGKQAECCGGGGGVLVTDKQLSEKLAKRRVDQAREIGVNTLVTLCPTCELNLKNVANRDNGNLEVKNVLDLVWQALQ